MQEIMVSIIVPVYNTQKYLDACMKSIVNQTYSNLEIIIIDDGSDEKCAKMCDEWAKKDERIIVIHKKNAGLGYARNSGLDIAKGEYVTFLDSDDTIELDTYEKCIDIIVNRKLDSCCFAKRLMTQKGDFTYAPRIPKRLHFEGAEVKMEFAKIFLGPMPNEIEQPFINLTVCCFLYSRKIIEKNDIRFMSERDCLSEDLFFQLEFFEYATKISIIPEYLHNYTYNDISLTKNYKSDRLEKIKQFYKYLIPYKERYSSTNNVNLRIDNRYVIYLRHYIEMEVSVIGVRGLKKTYAMIMKYCNDEVTREVLQRYPLEEVYLKRKIFIYMVKYKWITGIILYYIISNIKVIFKK